jgi:hypothetical protein
MQALSCSNRRTECPWRLDSCSIGIAGLPRALCWRRFIPFLRTDSGVFIRTTRLPSEPPLSPPSKPSRFPSASLSLSSSVPLSSPSALHHRHRLCRNHPAPCLRLRRSSSLHRHPHVSRLSLRCRRLSPNRCASRRHVNSPSSTWPLPSVPRPCRSRCRCYRVCGRTPLLAPDTCTFR